MTFAQLLMLPHKIFMTMMKGRFPILVSAWLLCSLIITFQSLRHSDRVLKLLIEMNGSLNHGDRQAPQLTPTQQLRQVEETTRRPPFHTLINRNSRKIVGNVQFLLDFALIGFSKCTTTASINWVASHPEAQVLPRESQSLKNHRPDELVFNLYYSLPEGRQYKRGYKNPGDLKAFHPVQYLSRYFPETKLMIALRHPVLRFESFYNFRSEKIAMPPPNDLIGKCTPASRSVCTDSAALHHFLARLGKTNMTSPDELELLQQSQTLTTRIHVPNQVFLYTDDQFGDRNTTRSRIFAQDIQNYLGFEQTMPPIPSKPQIEHVKRKQPKINICDETYDILRNILMRHSRAASLWIRHYLLKSDDVFVSSREHFEELVEKWMEDPCVKRRAISSAPEIA